MNAGSGHLACTMITKGNTTKHVSRVALLAGGAVGAALELLRETTPDPLEHWFSMRWQHTSPQGLVHGSVSAKALVGSSQKLADG